MNEPLRNLMKDEIESLKKDAFLNGQAQTLELFRRLIESGRKNDVERATWDDEFFFKVDERSWCVSTP